MEIRLQTNIAGIFSTTYLRSPGLFPPLSLLGFPLELLQLLGDFQPVGGLGLLARDPGDGDLRELLVVPLHHWAAATAFPNILLFPRRRGRARGDVLRGAEVEKSCWSSLVPAGLLGDDGHGHAQPHLLRRALRHRHLSY